MESKCDFLNLRALLSMTVNHLQSTICSVQKAAEYRNNLTYIAITQTEPGNQQELAHLV